MLSAAAIRELKTPCGRFQANALDRRRASTRGKQSPQEDAAQRSPPRFAPASLPLPARPPSSSDLRLSLFRAFTGRMTLPIPRGHIIILHAKALAAQPIITLLQFIHLKLIFQVEHHSFDAVLGDRVMFLRPATTLNRLYFNHE
jgi:hypothetical protein